MNQHEPDPARCDAGGQRPRLRFHLPLDPARLLRARHRIRDYLHDHEVDPLVVNDVVLAVEEAMTNAMRHSAAEDDVEVGLSFAGDDLVAEVRDHGHGFDVSTFDPNALPDLERTSGRGLYLISRLTDELTLASDGGVELRAVKRGVLRAAQPAARAMSAVPGALIYRDARERALLDEVEDEYFAFDWEYRLVHANAVVTHRAGRPLAELLGLTLWELLAPSEPLTQRVEQAMQLGRPAIVEYESGLVPERWLEARIYPASFGLSIFSTDITERKRSELAHRESLRRSQLLARTTARLLSADEPQAVIDDLCHEVMEHLRCHMFFNYLLDEEAGCLRLNARAGIDDEEAQRIGRLDLGVAVCGCAAAERRMLAVDDVQGGGDERAALVRGYGVQAYAAHPLLVEDRLLGTLSFGAKDRTSFTAEEISLMKLIADQVAIAVDRQQSRQALQRSEELFRTVVDNISDGIWMYDVRTGHCVLINPAEEAHTGFGIEEMSSASREWVDERFHPDDQRAVAAFYELAEGDSAPRPVEYRWRVRSGEYRWFNYRRSLVRDASGLPLAVVSVSTDVTDRRRREASQALLTELASLLGTLTTADEIMAAAASRLARHLDIPMVAVLEVKAKGEVFATRWAWSALDEPSPAAQHALAEFVDAAGAGRLRDGETLVVGDTGEQAECSSSYTSFAVGAVIVVPFTYEGIWRYNFVVADGSTRRWREDEVDLVRDVAGIAIPRLARAEAEAALRESEARYQLLYDSIDQGYFIIDVLFDDSQRPVDLLYLQGNRAATAMLGSDYTGRRLSEISPDYEPYWVEIFGEVARTGRSTRRQLYAAPDKRWYDFYVFRIGGPESRRVGNTFTDITVRKRAEVEREGLVGALAQQRGRLQAIIDTMPAGLVIADADGRVVFLNEMGRAILKYRGDLPAAPDVVLPPHPRSVETRVEAGRNELAFARALDGEVVRSVAFDVELRDGSKGTHLVSAAPIRNEAGEPAGAVLVTQDITERRHEAEALRQSEERLAEILQAAGAGVWDMEVKSRTFTWSVELYDLLGLDPERVAPTLEAWFGVLHPDDRDHAYNEIGAALQTGRELNIEYRIIRDGEIRWVNALGRRRGEEEASHISGICIDITRRKRLEEQVARREQEAQHLIRHAPAAIFELDMRTSRFLSVNEYVGEFTGHSEEELLAMDVRDLLAEEDRERVGAEMLSVLAGEESESSFECRFRTRQGEVRRAILKVSPQRDADQVTNAFVVAYDITERARAEEALRASERRYRQLFEGLQEGFVHRLPEVPGLMVSALSLSAHRPELIGGDFHDVFALPDGRVMILIGDVMGKGARAAGLTETVRAAARVVALSSPAPEKILEQVNRLLLKDEYEQFVSTLVLVLDPRSGRCKVASGGHPAPVLLTGDDVALVEVPPGPLLGIYEGSYEAAEFLMPDEAVLVLYTDGLTEARRAGELFGERRLREALARAAERDPFALAERLHADVLEWAGELKDDLEILALRRSWQTSHDEGQDTARRGGSAAAALRLP